MKENHKITFIIRSLRLGGAERVLSELCNYLCEYYDISIITFNKEESEYSLNERIKRINLNFKITKKDLFSNIRVLKKACIKENADVFLAFDTLANIYGLMALKNSNYKIGICERNAPKQSNYSLVTNVLRTILYRNANFWVFQTTEEEDCYKEIISKNHSYIIANPVRKDLPTKNYENNDNEIIAIGRLCHQKNYPLLLEAFTKFHYHNANYKLRIFGEGSDKEELVKLCKECGISENVVFEGNHKNVHREILNAKFFVLSSHFEGIPNVLLEAMAIGFPVIATDCPAGGPRELIKNNVNGLLVKNEDPDSLFDAMMIIENDYDKAIEMGKNAMYVRDQYSIEKIATLWIHVIETEISGASDE